MTPSGNLVEEHFELEFPDDQSLTDLYTGNQYDVWIEAYTEGKKRWKDFNIVQVTVVKQVFPIRLDNTTNKQE